MSDPTNTPLAPAANATAPNSANETIAPAQSFGDYVRNTRGHLKTINSHRRLVRKLCFKAGIPWQGLTHDLSKYQPVEFVTGMRYFQGFKSPNGVERDLRGYSQAWLHHKGRNRHHFEYWVDVRKGSGGSLQGMLMPTRYVVEMLCDRLAATKIYQKDDYTSRSALDYFERELQRGSMPIHEDTAAFLYALLELVAEQGEDEAFAFIRENVVKPRYIYAEGGEF